MANPPTARSLGQPLDPYDLELYNITITRQPATADVQYPVLDSAEQVASFGLATTAEAAAAGLTIESSGARAPTLVGDVVYFWLSVDSGLQTSPLFNGAGVDLGIEMTVVTNASPYRRKQKTYVAKVANQ